MNMTLNSENLHYPPVLSKSPKKLQIPENREEQLHFENRYTTFMHLAHLIPIYSYRPNIILTSMKIHNPQASKKSSVKALKTAKNLFPVMKAICSEICTFKTSHFRILRFAGYNHGAAEPQGIGCVHSQRTGYRQLVCHRLVSRFYRSRLVEITPKHSTAKFTLTLKLKVKFFRDHRNQPNPNQVTQTTTVYSTVDRTVKN